MPVYQNDASTLADIVGPAYAAQQAGIQNDTANQQAQLDLAIKQGQAPALMQQEGLKNLFTQAQTNLMGQQATGLGLGNLKTANILPGEVAATNSANQLKLTQDQAQKLGTLGQMAGQVASYLDNVPPPARPAAMQQIAQQYQIPLDQLPGIASGDPDMLRSLSQKMIQQSAGFQTTMAQEQQRGQNQADVAQIEAGSRERVAETNAGARRYVADQQRQIKELNQNLDQAIVSLGKKIASGQGTPQDQQLMQALQQQQIMVRQMAAQTTQAILGMGGGVNPNQPPQVPVFAPQQGAPEGIPQPAGNTQPVGTQAPPSDDKYDYRIGPNGNIQRRPKQ